MNIHWFKRNKNKALRNISILCTLKYMFTFTLYHSETYALCYCVVAKNFNLSLCTYRQYSIHNYINKRLDEHELGFMLLFPSRYTDTTALSAAAK